MKVNRDFKGIWIPKEVYLLEDLSWTEKILLVEVDSLDAGMGCFATNKYLANFLGVGEWTISKSISKMVDMGLIMVRYIEQQRRLFCLVKYQRGIVKNHKGGSEKPKEGVVKNPIHSNTTNNTSNKTSSTKEQMVNAKKQKFFEEFWEKYDKKVGKKQCERKFQKMRIVDIERAMATVEEYVKSTPEVKYRKHPITWLNQEAWNDVLIKDEPSFKSSGKNLVIDTPNGKIIL